MAPMGLYLPLYDITDDGTDEVEVRTLRAPAKAFGSS